MAKYKLIIESEDIETIQKFKETLIALNVQGIKIPEIQNYQKVTEMITDDTITIKFHESMLIHRTIIANKLLLDKCMQYKNVVFDFDEVTFIDSEVINAFIKIRNNECKVKIINIKFGSEVEELLSLLQADAIFDIERKQ